MLKIVKVLRWEDLTSTETVTKAFDEILLDVKRNTGMYALAVVLRDGLIVASLMPDDVDEETLAAMTATIIKAAETAFTELNKGDVKRIIIEGEHAKIVAVTANKDFVVVGMANPETSLGIILHGLRKAAEKISQRAI